MNKNLIFIGLLACFMAANISYAQKGASSTTPTMQSMVEAKNLFFTIQRVDKETSPSLAAIELKGGYVVRVTPKEFTAYVPFIGPNVSRGNAPGGGGDFSIGTPDYTMEFKEDPEMGGVITITAKESRSGEIYTFVITRKNNQDKIAIGVSDIQDFIFFGTLREGKKNKH